MSNNIEIWLKKIADEHHFGKIALIQSAPKEVIPEMFKKMREDTGYFASVCMKSTHPYIPQHHTQAFKVLDDNTIQYVCQVWARKMGKTTTKRAKIVQALCFKLYKFIVLFSATNKQSVSDGLTIKKEFERNEVIKFLFGDMVTKSPWGQDHIALSNDTRMMTFSMQSSPRGLNIDNQRPDLVMLDDFEDKDNSGTVEGRRKIMDFILEVLKPIGIGSRTKFVFLGTVVDKDTFLGRANPRETDASGMLTINAINSWFKTELGGAYTTFAISKKIYDGTTDDIDPVWEDEYPLSFIKSEYVAFSSQNRLASFYQEYYNIPAAESNPVIDVGMIQEVDAKFRTIGRTTYLEYADGRKQACRVYIGVDPAIKTGPDCDDTVIFVLGLLPTKKYVFIKVIAEKIKIEEQPMRVYEAMQLYQAYAVVIECVQYQLSLYEQIKKICREKHKNFLLYPIEKRMSKTTAYMQIDGLCHVINTGLCSSITDCDMTKFKAQARAYSSGMKREHDDTLDGFSLALTNNYFPPDVNIEEKIKQERDGIKKKQLPKSFMCL